MVQASDTVNGVLRSGTVSDDSVYLKATRQAELIRAKQISPVEP